MSITIIFHDEKCDHTMVRGIIQKIFSIESFTLCGNNLTILSYKDAKTDELAAYLYAELEHIGVDIFFDNRCIVAGVYKLIKEK